jgi:hypothetical protein
MTQPQHPQQHQQQHPQQSGPPRQQPIAQQQPGNQYNQFMSALPSPIGTQQQRGSFSQFPNNPQMNQFRMMQQQQQQQQQQQSGQQQQLNYGQHPQGMQQMPQFFPQMGQQQYAQQPMQMPGHGVVGPPGTMPMGMQPNTNNNSSVRPGSTTNANSRPNMGPGDDQSDPLFMLKDM